MSEQTTKRMLRKKQSLADIASSILGSARDIGKELEKKIRERKERQRTLGGTMANAAVDEAQPSQKSKVFSKMTLTASSTTISSFRSVSSKRSDAVAEYDSDDDEIICLNGYDILEELGEGQYGTVFKAEKNDDPIKYAIKRIQPSKVNVWDATLAVNPLVTDAGKRKDSPIVDRKAQRDLLEREIAVMERLDHPAVVKLYEVIDDLPNHTLYLVMEYVGGGTIMPSSPNRWRPLKESQANVYFRQLCCAIEYCHERGVVHCDIKPDNLLLCDEHDHIKVADFGTSRIYEDAPMLHEDDLSTLHYHDLNDTSIWIDDLVGTPAFMSPEAFESSGRAIEGKYFDIWSAGVTLYCMLFGKIPFKKDDLGNRSLGRVIREDPLEFPNVPQVSENAKTLLGRLLAKDPAGRPTIDEIFEDDWITCSGENPLEHCDHTPIDINEEDVKDAVHHLDPSTVKKNSMAKEEGLKAAKMKLPNSRS